MKSHFEGDFVRPKGRGFSGRAHVRIASEFIERDIRQLRGRGTSFSLFGEFTRRS